MFCMPSPEIRMFGSDSSSAFRFLEGDAMLSGRELDGFLCTTKRVVSDTREEEVLDSRCSLSPSGRCRGTAVPQVFVELVERTRLSSVATEHEVEASAISLPASVINYIKVSYGV